MMMMSRSFIYFFGGFLFYFEKSHLPLVVLHLYFLFLVFPPSIFFFCLMIFTCVSLSVRPLIVLTCAPLPSCITSPRLSLSVLCRRFCLVVLCFIIFCFFSSSLSASSCLLYLLFFLFHYSYSYSSIIIISPFLLFVFEDTFSQFCPLFDITRFLFWTFRVNCIWVCLQHPCHTREWWWWW